MYPVALGFGVLLSLGIFGFFLRHRAFSLFHPLTIYSAFHILIFVIRPVFAFFLEYETIYAAYRFNPSPSDKLTVILAANLGYAVFAATCLRAGNQPVTFRRDSFTVEERRRLTQVFIWAALICGPIALYSLANNFSASGNYDGMVMDRATGSMINTKGNGYLTDAQMMLAPLCAVFAWLGRFRLLYLIPMAGFVVLRASTGGRGPFITALVMLLLLYLYEKRIRFPALRLGLAAAAIIALFSWIGEDRGGNLRSMIGMDQEETVLLEATQNAKFLESMDVANQEFFEFIVWVVPQQSGTYDYFLNNLQVFTEPVPRVLWPGKPIGQPIKMVRLFDYGNPIGMTPSLPGMGWYSMGWLGVTIWCGLWGFGTGTVYRRYWQGDQSTIKTAAYMVFVASLILAFRDGTLLTIVRQTGVYMAPLFVWFLIARYLGVPRLAEMRAWTLARARQLREAAAVEVGMADVGEVALVAPGAARQVAALPAAVRRRRRALQMSGEGPGKG